MFEIYAEIDGGRIPSNQLASRLKEKFLAHIVEQVKQKLEGVTCPEHGTHATVLLRGLEGTQLTFDIEGCCDKLTEACRQALS